MHSANAARPLPAPLRRGPSLPHRQRAGNASNAVSPRDSEGSPSRDGTFLFLLSPAVVSLSCRPADSIASFQIGTPVPHPGTRETCKSRAVLGPEHRAPARSACVAYHRDSIRPPCVNGMLRACERARSRARVSGFHGSWGSPFGVPAFKVLRSGPWRASEPGVRRALAPCAPLHSLRHASRSGPAFFLTACSAGGFRLGPGLSIPPLASAPPAPSRPRVGSCPCEGTARRGTPKEQSP